MTSDSWHQTINRRATPEELRDARHDLENLGDRGTAIATVQALENSLRGLLVKNMVELDKNERKELFGPFRPMSEFAAKINLAYAFGLIDKTMRDDLNHIRDIRNAFAHDAKPVSFRWPHMYARCQRISLWKEMEDFVKPHH